MGRAKHRKLKKAGTKTLVSLTKSLPSRRPPEHKRFRELQIAKEKKAMAKKKRKAPGSHPPIKSHGDVPTPKQRSPAAEERRAAKQEKKRAKKQAKRDALSGRSGAAPPAAPPQPNGRPGSAPPAPPPATPKPLSNWLGKFLSTPRSTDIVDASGLEDAPMDDTYMMGFANRCRQESKPEAPDSSDDESVHVPPPPQIQETFSVFVANVPFAVSEAQVRAVCAEAGSPGPPVATRPAGGRPAPPRR